MLFLFGAPLAGTVDRVDKESIKTRFLIIILPLIPLGSFYVISESASFRLNEGAMKAIPIRMNAKSVLVGYLRMYCWVPTLIFWESNIPTHLGLQFLGAAYTGMALFACCFCGTIFGLGRLSNAEVQRRRQLRDDTGFGIDPEQFITPPQAVARGFPVVLETRTPEHAKPE